MRISNDILLDLLADPSIVELILSGPGMSAKDVTIGLAWILGTSIASKLTMDLAWPLLIRTAKAMTSRLTTRAG